MKWINHGGGNLVVYYTVVKTSSSSSRSSTVWETADGFILSGGWKGLVTGFVSGLDFFVLPGDGTILSSAGLGVVRGSGGRENSLMLELTFPPTGVVFPSSPLKLADKSPRADKGCVPTFTRGDDGVTAFDL